MDENKFVFTEKINKDETSDYIGMVQEYKPKDKYMRLNEYSKTAKPPVFIRTGYKFEDDGIASVKLPDKYRFSLLPYIPLASQEDRTVMYLASCSGSGKTYTVNEVVVAYKAIFPANKVHFLTMNNWRMDRSLEPKDNYEFVNMEEWFEKMESDDELNDFIQNKGAKIANCMYIFDDIGVVKKKKHKDILWTCINAILENFRKMRVSICIISHLSTDYKATRLVIRELKNYVIYPANLQIRSDNILTKYLGLSKEQVDRIIHTDSKTSNWVSIDVKKRLVLTQDSAYFL